MMDAKAQQALRVKFATDELHGLTVTGYRETDRFSTMDGQLVQWIELDVVCTEGWRKFLSIEIRSGGKSAGRLVAVRQGQYTLRGYAPALWPDPPDEKAELILTCKGQTARGTLTVGGYRPWTLYLLSDCCADDSWAYSDLEQHDRDDYRTTWAELTASASNCYNYPSVYQIARFCRYATSEEKDVLRDALESGRFYLSPVPNQQMCGAFTHSAYPLLLEPYSYWRGELGLQKDDGPQVAAYHMEAPTWTNGLVNLFSCAGFRLFGKSLLRYLAPWIDALETLPILTRLEVAPGRYVYLVLSPNSYSVGFPLLAGQPHSTQELDLEIISSYETKGAQYPTSAIPIVGLYSDLAPELPDWVPAKLTALKEYTDQEWEYPRLVNATWEHLAAHVERELGKPGGPVQSGLCTVRGGSGSSWEAWMSAAQAEMARFRRAQRDVVSLRTLDAMLGGNAALGKTLQAAVLELVELGDHAWNGSSEASKQLNLSIRRDRLARVEASVSAVRSALFQGDTHGGPPRFGVVNTLGWARTCRVPLPRYWLPTSNPAYLENPETGETFPVLWQGGAPCVYVTQVPAFGYCEFELLAGVAGSPDRPSLDRAPLALGRMRPLLIVGERELDGKGGWAHDGSGAWDIGPFSLSARAQPSRVGEGLELLLAIEGTPPEKPYELRWLFDLPWKEAIWRGESGGGFVTPGPIEQGGDSLLGITGSIFSCGEALTAMASQGDTCIDFAFDQTGMCGLGGRSTRAAQGTYGERLDAETVALSVWSSTRTPGRLELYLLGTAQNHREALLDQGGARRWQVRCGLRRRASGFDDAALYRFGCGFNYPAELVDPELWDHGKQWLAVTGNEGVIVLGAHRAGETICCDLYNTLREGASIALSGPVVEGRSVRCADMLGRALAECWARAERAAGALSIDPLAFLRVVVQ